jgi:hypothetical protein
MRFALGLALGAAVAAGQQAPVERKEIRIVKHAGTAAAGQPAGDVLHFVSAEFGWEEESVKNAPYSAEAVTDTVQALADGNRIVRKTTAQVYRDSEGRTRREQTMEAIGGWSAAKRHKVIFIHDPVVRVDYILDPQNRTARKIALPEMPPPGSGPVNVEVETGGEFTRPAPPPPFGAAHGAAVFVAGPGMAEGLPEQSQAGYKSESLGKQTIEGVLAEGTRTVQTIAAGQIGNERPIEIVSERWFSPELRTVLSHKRSDPRFGETSYRLTNLRRGEPDASLFQPPADYTVKTEDVKMRVMKFKEKKD